MLKVIKLYNLKSGASMDEFKRRCKEVYLPVCQSLPGIWQIDFIEIKSSSKEKIPFQIAEVADTESYEEWQKIDGRPDMQEIVNEWLTIADESSAVEFCGEKIK